MQASLPTATPMSDRIMGTPSPHGDLASPHGASNLASASSHRHIVPVRREAGTLASRAASIDISGREALQMVPTTPGCACIRHWSEVPVWAIGALGVSLLAMGALGGPMVYYVAGGIDLAAAVPLFPIVRRYGTIQQQVGMLEEVITRQKRMLEAVQQQLRTLNAEVAEFAENESEISEHVDVLTDGIQTLKEAARVLGERIAASRAHRDQLTQETGEQAEEIRKLHQALNQRTEELNALQETVRGLTSRPEALLRAIDERCHALSALGMQLEQVRPVLDEERGLLTALQDAAAGQTQAIVVQQELRSLGERLDHFTTALTQTAESQSQQLARMQQHREALEQGLPRLHDDLDVLERRIRELRSAESLDAVDGPSTSDEGTHSEGTSIGSRPAVDLRSGSLAE